MDSTSATARTGLAAAASAALWTAKSVAIGVAGGLDRSPAETPLFVLGLVASLVAVTALLLTWTRGRSPGVRLLTALAGVPALFLLVSAIESVVRLVEPSSPGWVWSELSLWAVAAAVLGAALVVRRESVRRPRTSRVRRPAG
ncbi:hypothetical protein [Ornithinimicrobium avium]|uniref:hypothetical protein n=1 Tax=Ornithinimicrobium avium TaxID=2283195 RepID=UPI0013B3C330|nr:hypothetical protein [Ornithinimicrobium avium]